MRESQRTLLMSWPEASFNSKERSESSSVAAILEILSKCRWRKQRNTLRKQKPRPVKSCENNVPVVYKGVHEREKSKTALKISVLGIFALRLVFSRICRPGLHESITHDKATHATNDWHTLEQVWSCSPKRAMPLNTQMFFGNRPCCSVALRTSSQFLVTCDTVCSFVKGVFDCKLNVIYWTWVFSVHHFYIIN